MNIQWSPLAIDRVKEIVDYIAQNNPIAAAQWADRLFESVEALVNFPYLGRVVPEIQNAAIRELIKEQYRVVYKVDEAMISILTVHHSRQQFTRDTIDTSLD